ncbi:acyltransferase [Rhizobiaceae bacterium n13]|uniref:Acyltransferase n=1 Tax=Ferirhizobium litorale TaxID=2927786 RepID=A0AAE3U2F6_9HYPH|nr:acyltransferase family protein [Fererhizobium litorale]MDI7863638.1 acyltransferase [Fererhizobium litorale]MDI7923441.1 acyltransferase [Fererhizobium litorale]
MSGKYRPDIDGLRTIAVLSVVFYHAGFNVISGGFVGVDVFFVISGFLITRIIVDEVDGTGSFSFSRFYIRRARRLFPALFSTVFASFVLGLALLPPEQMQQFAGSIIYSLTSLSNFFFWWQSGYFDAEAASKPLLHTWSLSVEEQFYLVWPALMSLLLIRFGQRLALGFVIVSALLSLAVAQFLLVVDPAAAFFLLPARIVELAIGGAMVWAVRWQPKHGFVCEAALVAGLALIALPIFLFTSDTPFPGLNALIPCLGTALVIYAGTARYAGLLLRNPVSVLIGKASYSIYLVHWPLVVFYATYTFDGPGLAGKFGLVALAIVLGALQYWLVEQRFRHEGVASMRRTYFAAACAGLALVVALPAASIWQGDGASWRIPGDRLAQSNLDLRMQEKRTYCGKFSPDMPKAIFPCQFHRGKDKDLILWGDSHALHLVAGFAETYPDFNVYVATMSGCVPQNGFAGYVRAANRNRTQECIAQNRALLDFLPGHRPSFVVVTSAKRDTPEEVAAPINAVMDDLARTRHTSIYLGDFIRPGRELGTCSSVPELLISDEMNRQRCIAEAETVTRELAYNEAIAKLVRSFVPVNDIQCPQGRCVFYRDETPLFRDSHHLSMQGSAFFVADLKRKLEPLLNRFVANRAYRGSAG